MSGKGKCLQIVNIWNMEHETQHCWNYLTLKVQVLNELAIRWWSVRNVQLYLLCLQVIPVVLHLHPEIPNTSNPSHLYYHHLCVQPILKKRGQKEKNGSPWSRLWRFVIWHSSFKSLHTLYSAPRIVPHSAAAQYASHYCASQHALRRQNTFRLKSTSNHLNV